MTDKLTWVSAAEAARVLEKAGFFLLARVAATESIDADGRRVTVPYPGSIKLIECYCRGKTEPDFYCNPPMLSSGIKGMLIKLGLDRLL